MAGTVLFVSLAEIQSVYETPRPPFRFTR
jgi:hypothetical protein